ncbi:MAG TPA: hypothetical protein VIW24_08605 [Aldersonia sp.]
MKMYVVYDKRTGNVLHTHASYVLGSDEPVAAREEEVLALAPNPGPESAYGVAAVPDGFDIRSRLQELKVDASTGTVRIVNRDRPGPERATAGDAS